MAGYVCALKDCKSGELIRLMAKGSTTAAYGFPIRQDPRSDPTSVLFFPNGSSVAWLHFETSPLVFNYQDKYVIEPDPGNQNIMKGRHKLSGSLILFENNPNNEKRGVVYKTDEDSIIYFCINSGEWNVEIPNQNSIEFSRWSIYLQDAQTDVPVVSIVAKDIET